MDLLEHLDHFDVGTAVQRSPQGAHARRARGEQVGLRRTHDAHGERAAVLFVVGVQQQHQIQSIDDLRRANVLLVRQREHHVQQVLAVPQLGVRDS